MKKFCVLIALAITATFSMSTDAKAQQPMTTPAPAVSSPASPTVVYYNVNGILVPVQQGIVYQPSAVYQPTYTTWSYPSYSCCNTVRYYYPSSCCNTWYYSQPCYYRTTRCCGRYWW